MNALDKPLLETDISLGRLLDTIDGVRDLPLIFSYDGQPVKGGYHVTEVKAGQFAALDCGAEHEEWSEIFVQLWDIDEDDRPHMPAGKFAASPSPRAKRAAMNPATDELTASPPAPSRNAMAVP